VDGATRHPEGATGIACRVDGEWLVDVIRDACVQQVWDARYDGERATITALPGTHVTRALSDGPVPAARVAAPRASALGGQRSQMRPCRAQGAAMSSVPWSTASEAAHQQGIEAGGVHRAEVDGSHRHPHLPPRWS
jgi:hypothetical protein